MSPSVLRSPASGLPLRADTPHSLAEPDGRRWPVVDGIPFLRAGREALAATALEALDRGDREGALMRLLADQDDWWTGPNAAEADLRRLVRRRDALTLRDAMALLGWGRVADYFAYRWSDPTYLAGLALLEAHWRPASTAFELACGIGHYGREFLGRGVAYTGADVVFAKLWVARHWVVGGDAGLVCFDAAAPWPVTDSRVDLALCQDAFYFLEPKAEILDALRAMIAPCGWLAVGHVHNRETANLSAGAAVTADAFGALFPDGLFYDDAELTRALVEARRPAPGPCGTLRGAEAFAVAAGPGLARAPRSLASGFAMPASPDGALRANPLYAPLARPHPEPPASQPALDNGFASDEPLCRAVSSFPPAPRRWRGTPDEARFRGAASALTPASRTFPAQEERGAANQRSADRTVCDSGRDAGRGGGSRDADGRAIAWPSERYRAEYEALATYPARFVEPRTPEAWADAVRRRALVDLPERW